MPATAYTANLIAKAIAHGSAYQGPATIYLGLATDLPSATVAGTPPDDASYARVAFDQTTKWDDDGAGTLSNNAKITWPTAAADYPEDVEAIEAFDAASAGNRLWYQPLSAPISYVAGDAPEFGIGELTLPVV